ncbi:sigma factor [Cohnella rhizosphaerae]|uniref:RNA polymerase sigma-70 region 2 domain-containing protein n=1 Tax=Cohnella rhizosphaerae TaxID=1457232 RepID=A0A9X4KTH0_9BACL|nr:sigma factor [Cohnella rhizosphaerae]MDG0810587.1 hypothetical protein [Cohnella rhizosphaerae]
MDVAQQFKKAQKGNVAAFEQLIHAHKTVMYRVAKTILASDADCEDAIQEAIIKAAGRAAAGFICAGNPLSRSNEDHRRDPCGT